MESPAVSGAQDYKGLCLAAKKEERRLAELKRKQQYLKGERSQANNSGNRLPLITPKWPRSNRRAESSGTGNKTDQEGNQQRKQLRCCTYVTVQNIWPINANSKGQKVLVRRQHKTRASKRLLVQG